MRVTTALEPVYEKILVEIDPTVNKVHIRQSFWRAFFVIFTKNLRAT